MTTQPTLPATDAPARFIAERRADLAALEQRLRAALGLAVGR